MSIFGTGSPSITTSDLNTTLTLSNAFDRRTTTTNADIMHQSDIDLERLWNVRGEYIIWGCHLYLYKRSVPLTDYGEIITHYGTEVYVRPFGDVAYRDLNGEDVLFYFAKCYLYNLDTSDYKDALYLEFESKGLVNTNALESRTITDTFGKTLTDTFGKTIGT